MKETHEDKIGKGEIARWITDMINAVEKEKREEFVKKLWKRFMDSGRFEDAVELAERFGLEELLREAGKLACWYYKSCGDYEYATYMAKRAKLPELVKEIGEQAYERYMSFGNYSKAREIARIANLGKEKIMLAEALDEGMGKYAGRFKLSNGREIWMIWKKEKQSSIVTQSYAGNQ